ncbi:MAG: anti-sigma factor antagonist [Bacilli bacterium]|nr:anti-sigma factor antagonist [Bacilli bacterium]
MIVKTIACDKTRKKVKYKLRGGSHPVLSAQVVIKKYVLYVRLDGELDQYTVEGLRTRIVELMEKYQIKYLVINCEQLRFMDSSGVGFIIGRYNRLKKKAGAVVLCAMNEHINRLVQLSGLHRICVIKKNEEEADKFLGVA